MKAHLISRVHLAKVEQLSGVGAAVIQDVKMLRQKFRQEVVYDQLKEIERLAIV